MRERPILFSAPMVRAILNGTKTQTRRVVKIKSPKSVSLHDYSVDGVRVGPCPYGQPGDRLWVRETWAHGTHAMAAERDGDGPFVYAATDREDRRLGDRWRPSIHMPRAASRITLEITGVRVERLQDISDNDALAEGVAQAVRERLPKIQQCGEYDVIDADPVDEYRELWESINGPASWESNPWVWVVSFQPIDAATSAADSR